MEPRPAWESQPDLLALHALRLKGAGEEPAIARRYDLDRDAVHAHLVACQAAGWVRRVSVAGTGVWTVTDPGRTEDSRRLAQELVDSGAGEVVKAAHADFLPLNQRLLAACTDWQIRPLRWDPAALNDHTNYRWDSRVLDEFASIGKQLSLLDTALSAALRRFAGYGNRYSAARRRAERGEWEWIDGARIDSCHSVWMELHEDLLSTLGLARADEQ